MQGDEMAAHETIAAAPSSRLAMQAGAAAGWSGLAMLVAIVANGPLAALRGLPVYWATDAGAGFASYFADPARLELAVVFFFLSTLIFVFGIPFFAGLHLAVRTHGRSDLAAPILTIAAALFFTGGLVSEVMSTGMATVVQSVPAYTLDANAALGIQGLQFAALIQGQVGLGVAILAVSAAMRSLPAWRLVVTVGLLAGTLDLVRPLAVTNPPLAIGVFAPTFVWIALASIRLVRGDPSTAR
jgi:hypothetical protein